MDGSLSDWMGLGRGRGQNHSGERDSWKMNKVHYFL